MLFAGIAFLFFAALMAVFKVPLVIAAVVTGVTFGVLDLIISKKLGARND
jgi:hypothetical protein